MILSNEELLNTVGGGSFPTSQMLNSLVKMINALLELGRTVGSAFRYVTSGKKCS